MVDIRERIEAFIYDLEKDHSVFKYLYSDKGAKFDPDKDSVYYSGPYWDNDEKISILEAILLGKWISAGEYVHEFEKLFSKKFNFMSSHMVNSGSSANLILISSLKKHLGWKDEDEIIVSPAGFPTTLSPIIQNRLKPVFIDVSIDNFNIDVHAIEKRLTDRTRAIFLSPVLGNPPNMDILVEVNKKYNVQLILDDCDSLGSKWRGKYLSDYCIASTCSFYASHHITTGQGGIVSSRDKRIIDITRSLSSWGRDCSCVGAANLMPKGSCGKRFSRWIDKYDGIIDHRYLFTNVGYNLSPLDLQGAIGVSQLRKFDDIVRRRRANKKEIDAMLEKYITGIRILKEHELAEASWFAVGIVCEDKRKKEDLVAYFENNRIQTRNYFAGNLLMHPAFENLAEMEEYPNSNLVMERLFFIGCSPTINKEMLKYIEEVVSKYEK